MRLNKHTSGSVAGLPFQLEPWQCFVIWSIFGWRVRGNIKARRFRKVYIRVPRKNGKTEFLAALANVEMMIFPTIGGEIYWGATHKKQSKIGWDRQEIMIRGLMKMIKSVGKNFKVLQTGSRIVDNKTRMFSTVLGRDSHTLDGLLVQMGLIDEYHAHKKSDLVDVLETAMGSFESPILIIITTAGYNTASPCKHLEDNYKKILSGDVENEMILPIIYELDEGDDWEDTENWYKVNPSLGASLRMDYMMAAYGKALLEGATSQLAFQVKNLNIWTNSLTKWIPDRIWKESNEKVQITKSELKGRVCTGGFDGSSVQDLTAFSLYFELENAEAAALTWFWCPEGTVAERTKRDGVKYLDWILDGEIRTTPGDAVDMEIVTMDILEILKEYDCKAINYDKWGTQVFEKIMVEEGWGEKIHPFVQNISSYNGPIKHFSRVVRNRRFKHFNNPVFTWNIMNVLLISDGNENLKFDKDKSSEKIDGAVSVTMACGATLSLKEDESIYETRGLRIL
jgi:phage terminase large subunit-like protein